jgi:hypothetical protein
MSVVSLKKKNYLTIDGKHCEETQRVGYCWLDKHPGYITLPIMREHKCIEKKCTFFQKYSEAPYWKEKEIKRKKKEAGLNDKRIKKETGEKILSLFRAYTKNIEDFAITRVEYNGNFYTVFFVTLNFVPLNEITMDVRKQTGAKIQLKEIKTNKTRKLEIINRIK